MVESETADELIAKATGDLLAMVFAGLASGGDD